MSDFDWSRDNGDVVLRAYGSIVDQQEAQPRLALPPPAPRQPVNGTRQPQKSGGRHD